MKKMLFRVLAYAMDMVIVSAITLLISTISFVNPGYKEYKAQYEEITGIRSTYYDFASEYNKVIEDSKITTEEKDKLNEKSPEYTELLNDYIDKDLSDEDKTKINDNVQELFSNKYNDLAYNMTKNNSITKIVTIMVTILYFGIIQYILKGKTVGKYVFKLRVVNNKDIEKNVPLYVYIARAILIGEVLLIAADLITLYATNQEAYLGASNIINTIQYMYEIAFLIVMMMREDGRSVHDLLLNTRVALFDKAGKEVIEEKKEEVEEVKKEEPKKVTSKKTTTKKKTSKKKEFVSAEKVDD